MVYNIADNILSPIGQTTAENYQAVKAGQTSLSYYEHQWDIPEPFTASLFSEAQNKQYAEAGLTRFESLVSASVRNALEQTTLDISSPRVVFILSTTKANVELLGEASSADEQLFSAIEHPGESARRIAERLGIKTSPILVCNACISGAGAIILADRLLHQHTYDYAIVCGADVLNRFVISGFQSFKSMDARACRPFDIERLGMNLGEATATIILSRTAEGASQWAIGCGAIRNDAHHISTPSNKGEGALRCLLAASGCEQKEDIAQISAHGTATMFMDQMESVAIERAGLADIPVNSVKGYYGHTLGAAGVLETILTMHALDDHTIIGTRGFEELGVSGKIKISASNTTTDKHDFIKLISGFGGCNAAFLASKTAYEKTDIANINQMDESHRVKITPTTVTIDGIVHPTEGTGKQLLTSLYKQYVGDYPKYYKMDGLSRLGFIASELLLQQETAAQTQEAESESSLSENRAIILFNHSSSLHADKAYLDSIKDADNYFPSPSLFVYTLPNIVTGEMAIRNHYHGETSFYILAERNEQLMHDIQQATFADPTIGSMITGWLDYENDDDFTADIYILNATG